MVGLLKSIFLLLFGGLFLGAAIYFVEKLRSSPVVVSSNRVKACGFSTKKKSRAASQVSSN